MEFLGKSALFLLLMVTVMAGEEKNEEKWDVANPPDETYQINIDTTEGTWMSVDVSPDGKQLVFDMLGDIFIIPISGGEAKQLAGGLPWEMQPRFSPDGKAIVYTSDRGGGDNIWVMDVDGSNPHQVSKESFRLLNSPDWSPDGDYIVARKHFTKTRSLGAGEIWLYHKTGGSGMQLTKKPNDQKDVGEPAFSPDGRYVYFSQDTTPGPVFAYNKDPEPGIYTIRRLDRETGEIEDLIGGNGGAIRPTPSPDGRYLAYIRRKDYDTTLFLHDLASGRNRAIYGSLDRDLQETWAIHGVYSNISWTPDGQKIVFWAGGQIHSLDVASGKDSLIPFHVKTTHTMVKPVRFPVPVAPDQFDVNMLRWVQVSPDGSKVVYQALGRLYIKDLPDGEPHRLTDQNDHSEQFPSFSRDGKSIVYSSWNDEELGAIRVVSVDGGKSKKVTSTPGIFTDPVIAPDGDYIVYLKQQDGRVLSSLYEREPGIYVVPTSGGESKRISKQGSQLHFGKDTDRVFFVTEEDDMTRTLRSIQLDGQKEREHASSEKGGVFRVSPDGTWLTFTEPYSVHICPLAQTGGKISIGPGGSNVPVQKVSVDAGNYLHWSADSKRVYWSLGNKLYQRDLSQSFAFLKGAPETLPEPTGEGIYIGFKADSDKPSGTLVLQGARIITMNGDEVIENGMMVIEQNRIAYVGQPSRRFFPKDAKTIDVSGLTIIPGLIDVHAHGTYAGAEIVPDQNWDLYAGLAFGVTTIHNPSSDTGVTFAASEMARNGMITGPRIFSTGTILYGATVPQITANIDSLEDARFHLRRMKAAGCFSVKSYNQPRRDQRQQVIRAARELGMMVVPEGGSLFQHNMSMIADGHTGIEHAIPLAAIYSDVVQFWAGSDTHYTPTTIVGYGGIWGEDYWYDKEEIWKHPRLSKFVPEFILRPRSKRRTKAPDREYNHFRVAEISKKLTDAGVKVNMGAHGQREGLGAHWEIWMMAQGGMSPMEALRTATSNAASYLGLDGDIGSLVQGKLADLVILKGNPLEDIRNTETISYVMLNGRLYDGETMNETGLRDKERKPFFWELEGAKTPNATVNSHNMCAGCGSH